VKEGVGEGFLGSYLRVERRKYLKSWIWLIMKGEKPGKMELRYTGNVCGM